MKPIMSLRLPFSRRHEQALPFKGWSPPAGLERSNCISPLCICPRRIDLILPLRLLGCSYFVPRSIPVKPSAHYGGWAFANGDHGPDKVPSFSSIYPQCSPAGFGWSNLLRPQGRQVSIAEL
ncbi:uncharacterized protein VTP21DRAFT_11461 [Calcarisporiella thermophila]|uniref:uncharacterized protein n=1 Tax=Calcarisporiella thermophila TaxID=911321 RepID=UPI003743C5AA